MNNKQIVGKQEMLTEKLKAAGESYYNDSPLMSDHEFDRLLGMLTELEESSGTVLPGSPNERVGAPVKADSLMTVQHEEPALSLGKIKYKDREDLAEWQGSHEVMVSWKLDGLTLVLTYDNGELTSAVTRGDGYEGKDVTHNARYFDGIPGNIPYKNHLVVRGEALMTYSEFERINAESGGIYENPRNLASATVQMLDASASKKRKMRFMAFKMVSPKDSPETESERLRFLKDLGIETVEHTVIPSPGCSADRYKLLDKVEEFKALIKTLDYPTDGLVITMNDTSYGESLGVTGHHPRNAIALKWTDETVTGTISHIHWSVGKTGQITPVAVLKEPVRLGAGSNVQKASLHNLSIMENMPVTDADGETVPIGIGSKVQIYLANMIIPQIASCLPGDRITYPEKCPVCGTKTHITAENGIKVMYCGNHACPARVRGILENAFSKDGLNVKGLGPSQIEDLQEAGLITKYPAELYTLEKRTNGELPLELSIMDGWGEKSWENLLDAINASRRTDLRRFLFSLGIPMLGHDLSKKLNGHWKGDIEAFKHFLNGPDISVLTALDGVAEKKAMSIVDWCHSKRTDANELLMLNVLMNELDFEQNGTVANNSLSGCTFVITGAVHDYKNRDEFTASVEARGGKVSGSVSAKTTALVNNDTGSSSGKNLKAKALGIEIISEDEFIRRYGK